jgi:hypothetical protein
MAFSTLSIFGLVILGLLLVGALYYGYKNGLFGSFTSGTNDTQPLLQQEPGPGQYGGKRNKKSKSKSLKSGSMTTTGVYLLLGAVLVGYIMSYF